MVRPVDARICEMQCIVSKQASKERRNEGRKERGRRDVLYVVECLLRYPVYICTIRI